MKNENKTDYDEANAAGSQMHVRLKCISFNDTAFHDGILWVGVIKEKKKKKSEFSVQINIEQVIRVSL